MKKLFYAIVVLAVTTFTASSQESILLPTGKNVVVRIISDVNSGSDSDALAIVDADVRDDIGSKILIRRGTPVVIDAQIERARGVGKPASIKLNCLTTTAVDGQVIRLQGGYRVTGKSRKGVAMGVGLGVGISVCLPCLFCLCIKGEQVVVDENTIIPNVVVNDNYYITTNVPSNVILGTENRQIMTDTVVYPLFMKDTSHISSNAGRYHSNRELHSGHRTHPGHLGESGQSGRQGRPVSNEKRTEERLSAIEKVIAKLPDISGFLNLRYSYNSADKTNSFDIRRARLDFKGNPDKKLDWRFQVEFAGSPKILDAYLRYKIDSRLNIQAGEFKIPFSLENEYGPLTLEVGENSMSVSKLCNYSDLSGISANGRDIGLKLYGAFFEKEEYSILNYAVGVFNGNGINIKDDNRNKDFSGMLTVNPLKSLAVSGSYYNGSFGKRGDVHRRERVAAGVEWKDSKLVVRSEYLYGKTAGIESEGFYVTAGYFVYKTLQPVLKYDYFNQNKYVNGSRESDYTVGLNMSPSKYLFLQANYTYKMIESAKNANCFALQCFVKF